MNSRKKTKVQKLPSAKDIEQIVKNPRFAKAYQAIAKYQRGIGAGQNLSASFAVRACLAVLPTPQSRKYREEIWLKETGKSWKTLTEFPQRLHKMANEIENVNAGFFHIPESCENPILLSFDQLPAILRSYAETLNHRAATIATAGGVPSRSSRLVELSNFAKWVMGRYCDKEISELLNGAAEAMKYNCEFDALHLAQARHRYNLAKT